MDLYITRQALSGNVEVKVKDKDNNLIYENKSMELEDVIELDEKSNEELTLEIIYNSKLVANKRQRFKYCLNVFAYHVFPLIYRDNELYSYKAKLHVTKTFHINKLNDDCYLEYEPYQKNKIYYDSGEVLRTKEEVKYKYRYLTNIALIMDIVLYSLILLAAIVCNYFWIKEIK